MALVLAESSRASSTLPNIVDVDYFCNLQMSRTRIQSLLVINPRQLHNKNYVNLNRYTFFTLSKCIETHSTIETL